MWRVRTSRGWTQTDVAAHTDPTGRPYISVRVYIDSEQGRWPQDEHRFVTRMRQINQALMLPPGTLRRVYESMAHGIDPETVIVDDRSSLTYAQVRAGMAESSSLSAPDTTHRS